MTATGVEVFMMTLGPSTRRGGNVMGTTINIGNGEDSGQFGVTTRVCTVCVSGENKRTKLLIGANIFCLWAEGHKLLFVGRRVQALGE